MSPSDDRSGTILVVDDDRNITHLIRRWLESDGHTVVVADTGTAALEAVRAQKPDVVLLDVVIPGPNGLEVCRQLKQDPATSQIPIVLMSGLQHPANWLRGRELGAVEFLLKPLDVEKISDCVRRHLAQSRTS